MEKEWWGQLFHEDRVSSSTQVVLSTTIVVSFKGQDWLSKVLDFSTLGCYDRSQQHDSRIFSKYCNCRWHNSYFPIFLLIYHISYNNLLLVPMHIYNIITYRYTVDRLTWDIFYRLYLTTNQEIGPGDISWVLFFILYIYLILKNHKFSHMFKPVMIKLKCSILGNGNK